MKVTQHDPTDMVQPSNDALPECCCSIGGGAWRGFFFAGQMKAMQERIPAETLRRWVFAGCSTGAVIALALAIDYPYEQLVAVYNEAVVEARSLTFGVVGRGPSGPVGQMLNKVLHFLPEEELLARLRGRFAVTFNSRSSSSSPYVAFQATEFESMDELFEAIAGSGNIPGFTDWKTLFWSHTVAGVAAVDGGWSWASRRPLLPCRSTLYSLCCGEVAGGDSMLPFGVVTDVAPSIFVPVRKCFFTPSDAYIEEMLQDGYDNTLKLLISKQWADRLQVARQPTKRPARQQMVLKNSIDTIIQAGGGNVTAYLIRSTVNGQQFSVQRQRSEFVAMHKTLLKLGLSGFASNLPPALPVAKRGWFGRSSAEEELVQSFQAYLQLCLRLSGERPPPPLLTFLSIDATALA